MTSSPRTAARRERPRIEAAEKRSLSMHDMIKRIVEIDEEARKLTDEATALKIQAEQTIEEKKEKLKEDYLKRARQQIEDMKEDEKRRADEAAAAIAREQEAAEKKMLETYERNAGAWVDAIVNNVLA